MAKGNRGKNKYPKIGKKVCRSQFEYTVYKALRNATPSKSSIFYEMDPLPYVIEKNYIPDFTIDLKDGRRIYVEAKGRFAYEDRVKMEAVKKTNPDLDIRIVFQSDAPGVIRKGGKLRPTDWAKRHGFPCAVGEIPQTWFNDDQQQK